MDATIDLKALMVEREDCDAGTVSKLREGLAQGGNQFKSLKDANEQLIKKLETAPPALAKKLHLKIGITSYFLGYMEKAIEHLRHVEAPLGYFYLGRALANRAHYDEALKAFDLAEKSGYSAPQVQLQRAGIYRQRGELSTARESLKKLEDLSSYSAEFHFQKAGLLEAEGDRAGAVKALERAVELDQGHTGALFRLAYFNDQAGNDNEAISLYERCLKYPPVPKGVLNNLGILYEDNERYDKASECFDRLLKADPTDERARLFLKDAKASQTQFYSPDDETRDIQLQQVMSISVSDFELSVRSRNCLKKMGIRTLGDLTRISEQALLASKNFGETSLEEIRKMMKDNGLSIGQSLQGGGASSSGYEQRYRPAQTLSPEEQAKLNRSVSELNLSVRSRKCMSRLGIHTIGELISRSEEELLDAKNFGVTSLNEVKDKLAQLGLRLRGD
ncbi:MAG: tetratricopeptide repeat protein [Gemmataceae bacterium]|nr:tetratricopeptide repeat protein [Gemmataceae bacterium]